MRNYAVFLLYAGPDAVMPLASGVATFIGIVLLLWQQLITRVRQLGKTFHYRNTKLPSAHPTRSK